MIDLSEEDVEWNIDTTAKYLERAAPMKQWLEMEIGITGGEEDGVNNGKITQTPGQNKTQRGNNWKFRIRRQQLSLYPARRYSQDPESALQD